ncbi:MAG: putative Ser/Thr protein kinase [Arenicella sp.]|jgi:predicted Ser/Thr protein kinase
MSTDWSNYSLEQLRAHAVRSFRDGGGSRPDVMLIDINGELAVLKDQNGADKWFALLIGPILNWRECKALNKLANIKCVPNLLGKPDARSFLMSYHESEQITRLINNTPNWPVFFDKLAAAIAEVHAAGIAHNDLRNPTNTLVTKNGDPVLVDLVACFCKGQAWNLPNRWLFEKFCQVDKSAITKIKTRVAPELLNENDIEAKDIAGRPGMAVRALGQWIRRLSRKLFTGKPS